MSVFDIEKCIGKFWAAFRLSFLGVGVDLASLCLVTNTDLLLNFVSIFSLVSLLVMSVVMFLVESRLQDEDVGVRDDGE